MSESACCVWDFTCFQTETREDLTKNLRKECKQWCFQLEKAPTTGALHFQGRFSLKVKKRLTGVTKLFPNCHLSVTSTANRDNTFYVMKEDTRVEGPWSDKDEVIYVPRDIRAITNLLPWQEELLYIIKIYEPRKINIIYDPDGNSGKTTFTRYCMVNGFGQILPFCNDFKDIMRMVMDMPESKCYFMDMPRAIKKEKLYQLYSGIETVKNGYAYDDRYHFKQKLFDPPNIVVFTNVMPELDLLSQDRWVIWKITNQRLEHFAALRCNNRQNAKTKVFNLLEQLEQIQISPKNDPLS